MSNVDNGRISGRIARIVTDKETGRRKGFGFIADDEGGQWFFHASDLHRGSGFFDQMVEGMRVQFQGTQGVKGPRAVDVDVSSANG